MTWPGLTTEAVEKYFRKSIPTEKGHMRQNYQNTISTKVEPSIENDNKEEIIDMMTEVRTNDNFIKIMEETRKVYTDQTGRFPFASSKGNLYIIILYNYDANAILSQPIKSRSQEDIVKGIAKLYKKLKFAGLQPNFHILDNEAPQALKNYLQEQKVKFQLVPPHCH